MGIYLITLILLCINFIFTSKYKDTKDDLLKRLEYGRNHSLQITSGKLEFEYSEEFGIYCKANKDLYDKEFTFKIPHEYIICSYDMFPYKFELKEPVFRFLEKKYGKDNHEFKVRSHLYLFVLELMFVDFHNKTQIFEHLTRTNKDHYIVNYSSKVLEYLQILPRVFYTPDAFESEERKLQEYLGVVSDNSNEVKEIWDHIIEYVKSQYIDIKDYILPWISDYDSFNFFTNIISSRSYTVSSQGYERLFNKQLSNEPMGKKHLKMYSEYDLLMSGTCLIPFIDLCNHKNPKEFGTNDNFFFVFKKGEVLFSVKDEFRQGESYEYSYQPSPSNEKLFLSYGFYVDNNPYSQTQVFFTIYKEFFPKVKHDLCIKLKYFDKSFAKFYDFPDLTETTMPIIVNKSELNKKILNFLIIYANPMQLFDENNVYKTMLKEKWINFSVETWGRALYRMTIMHMYHLSKLSDVDILYSIHNTRKYYKENREKIINEHKTLYLYRLRRKMMQIARENKNILNNQLKMINKEIKTLLSDQFTKLRNFITEN